MPEPDDGADNGRGEEIECCHYIVGGLIPTIRNPQHAVDLRPCFRIGQSPGTRPAKGSPGPDGQVGLRNRTPRRAHPIEDRPVRTNSAVAMLPVARQTRGPIPGQDPTWHRPPAGDTGEDGTLARTGRCGELLVVIERHGGRALTFVWQNKGALKVTTMPEKFLADPDAFPQCLLARCLPQSEHDRQPCARRCRRPTDARNTSGPEVSEQAHEPS
jgi:hypothetical protein